MLGMQNMARKVFGSPNDRKLKSVRPLIASVNQLETKFESFTEADMVAKTEELKTRAVNGEDLEALLPEAFANVREAGKRSLGLRVFDVQLVGGLFLHRRRHCRNEDRGRQDSGGDTPGLSECPDRRRGAYRNRERLYWARRDAEWMRPVYTALGISVSVVEPAAAGGDKRAAYRADVTYATNNELGFDYLRDNMASDLASMVQRGHNYAIVDEVDSILIDEARTPLIISGPSQDRSGTLQSH